MKKIAVINDISGLGKCSLSAAIPVLSILGHQVCPIPTAALTAQTGYERYHMTDLSSLMEAVIGDWMQAGEKMDGFYSGFLSSPTQYEKVLTIYEALKIEKAFLLVDPIMGDHGVAFDIYSDKLRDGMRELIREADVATPNLTEACLLTDTSYEKIESYQSPADRLAATEETAKKILDISHKQMNVIVTGIRGTDPDTGLAMIGNMCVSPFQTIYLEQKDLGRSYSGTGDLLASCICGYLMKGIDLQTALEKTMEFIGRSIEDALKDKRSSNSGVNFETHLPGLLI